MWRVVREGVSDLWRRSTNDGVGDLAASLSYRVLLSMFPFAIFLAAAGSLAAQILDVADPTAEIIARVGDAMPGDARSVLKSQLDSVLKTRGEGLLSIGILGAIWAASAAIRGTMRAMNRAYDVEEDRPFWKQALIALGLTVTSAVCFVMAFALVMAGETLASALAEGLGLDVVYRTLFQVVRFALVVAGLLTAVAVLYWAALAGTRRLRWITPGSVLFVAGWLLVSAGFAQYVSRFGSYEATYGTLGGVVVLMVWLYLTSYLLLMGAELNGLLTQRERRRASAVGAERKPSGRRAA